MIRSQVNDSKLKFKMGKMSNLKEEILFQGVCSSLRQDNHFSIVFIFKLYSIFLNKKGELILVDPKAESKKQLSRSRTKSNKDEVKSNSRSERIKISIFGPENKSKLFNIPKNLYSVSPRSISPRCISPRSVSPKILSQAQIYSKESLN